MIRELEADSGDAVALKGTVSGDHAVEDHAQGEKVRASVHFLATQLLGRHVGWRSKDVSRQGQMGEVELRNSKIGDFSAARRGHQYVGGLHVAMNDALAVRAVECFRQLFGKLQCCV